MTATLAQRTADAAAVALKNAEINEHQRSLTDEVVRALKNVDVLRAYVPAVYGGPEYSPFETMSIIEALSAADGSTGWCATIASLTSHIAGCLPAEAAKEIFGRQTAGDVCRPKRRKRSSVLPTLRCVVPTHRADVARHEETAPTTSPGVGHGGAEFSISK